jgi:hypothetical protein
VDEPTIDAVLDALEEGRDAADLRVA